MDKDFKLNSRKFYQKELPPVRLIFADTEVRGSIESMNSSAAWIIIDNSHKISLDEGTVQLQLGVYSHKPAAIHVTEIEEIKRGSAVLQRVSVAFDRVQISSFDTEDAILSGLFDIPFRHQPSWYAEIPFLYSYKLVGDVEAIGAYSLILSTSLSNNILIPGLRMKLNIDLKHLGSFVLDGYISEIAIDQELSCMHLTFVLRKPFYYFLRSASEYILCFSSAATPAQLKSWHIPVDGYDSAIKVNYADTPEEFAEVLKLRHEAAIFDERIDPDTPIADLEDKYDAFSRQLVLRVGEKVVGCGRVLFVEKDANRSEISQYVKIPDKYFRCGFCEIGRITVAPEFRGGEIYINLMIHACRIGAENGLRYAFADSRPFLMNTYKKLGAFDTGKTINIPLYPYDKMHVIYFDHKYSFSNIKGSFIYWARVLSPMMDFGLRAGFVKWTPLLAVK
ncbi:MAG: GNAT family N-acyltransferase, partial [Candidatus Saccharibacteria bacterium]